MTIAPAIPEPAFEWEETKRRENMLKHQLDFSEVSRLWSGLVLTRRSDRDGEERWQSFGLLDGRVIAVVWTMRETGIRLISARVARHYEREDYADHVERSRGSTPCRRDPD